jgi:hypothetical protein
MPLQSFTASALPLSFLGLGSSACRISRLFAIFISLDLISDYTPFIETAPPRSQASRRPLMPTALIFRFDMASYISIRSSSFLNYSSALFSRAHTVLQDFADIEPSVHAGLHHYCFAQKYLHCHASTKFLYYRFWTE